MASHLLGVDVLGADSAPSLDDVRAGNAAIKRGMKGDSVLYVQALVGVIADGDFGAKTEAAVKAFQGAHGLAADGVVGKATMAALDTLAGGTGGVTVANFNAPPSAPPPSAPNAASQPGAAPSAPAPSSSIKYALAAGGVAVAVAGAYLLVRQ